MTFEVGSVPVEDVVEVLENAVAAAVGKPTMVAVRRLDWLRDFVSADPLAFDPEEWELEVSFLRHDGATVDPERLPDPRRTVVVDVRDRELLTARPREGGARPHANAMLERATGCPATARGWSTLRRIADNG